MSYWGGYDQQPDGVPPQCDPTYLENMSYYNSNQGGPPYYYNGQTPYQSDYIGLYNQNQVTAPVNSNNEEATSSQPSRKKTNKYWNNGRGRNERHGTGRTFRNEQRRDQENAEFARNYNQNENTQDEGNDEMREGANRSKTKYQKGYQYNSRYRNNGYENERKPNYKPRFENYEARSSPRYNNRGNRYQEYGAGSSREEPPRERNNWRRYEGNMANKKCSNSAKVQKKLDAASQRERLEQMLSQRMLECLVCCEKIKHTDKVWSCQQCYHILHLNCVSAWANSSKLDSGWRCPACQNVCSEIPKKYTCYCGKTHEPRPVPGVIPHACGDPCMRKGRLCPHKCTILCHPGPCPDCNVMVERSCGCGATQQTVKCSSDREILCEGPCNKMLECGIHLCEAKCHTGPCGACEHMLEQICHCGKVGRRVKCTAEFMGAINYECEDVCGKLLSCGNHYCEEKCHAGGCQPCVRDVALVGTCPCGRTDLEKPRSSCLDPIPCCDKICGKILPCGQPAAPHSCKQPCHEGPCPPCGLTTLVRCRCGHMGKDIACANVTTKADDARCERKCTKKRLCGKHRCNQRCCIEVEHFCPLPCNHTLTCGQHRCERTCHSGRCAPCLETSFEELYCECGASVLYPPIPCGTKPPVCNKPCSRQRPCGHEANHTCHIGACPPCTVLCKRWCYGKHEQRSAIPCYQEDFSCGLPCGKQMPCGTHKCEKACHLGPCPLPCKQKCTIPRANCGHPCGAPCHKPPCPEGSCKFSVSVTCPCGLQKSSRSCIEMAEEYKEMEMAQLRDKMADMMKDQAVDITDIVNKPTKRNSTPKILECTEDCRVLERNRRLAIGLQIRNPDLSQKLTPRYSDFMRNWAKKDAPFCQKVHEKLSELVHLAKQSKQKSRSHSFESMNRDKRHFVHEYCEHFGCDSAAYDLEPNRNVVATAVKDKSWMPSMSLLEVLQRESGQRRVPGPMLSKGLVGKSESVTMKLPGRAQKPSTPPGEIVDYFDNPPM